MHRRRLRWQIWITAVGLLCGGCGVQVGPGSYPHGTRLVLVEPLGLRIPAIVPKDQREKAAGASSGPYGSPPGFASSLSMISSYKPSRDSRSMRLLCSAPAKRIGMPDKHRAQNRRDLTTQQLQELSFELTEQQLQELTLKLTEKQLQELIASYERYEIVIETDVPGQVRVKLDGGAHDGLEVLISNGTLEPAPIPSPPGLPYLLWGVISLIIAVGVSRWMFAVIAERRRRRTLTRQFDLPARRPTLNPRPAGTFERSAQDDDAWLAWLESQNARMRARPRREFLIIE